MKARITAMLAVALVLMMLVPAALAREQAIYFYLNACESCHPEEDFADEFTRLTGKQLIDYDFKAYNVYRSEGRQVYEQTTQGMDEKSRALPLLFFGSEIYAGTASIRGGLSARFQQAENNTASIVYFVTTPACAKCAEARNTVSQLPAIVPVEVSGRIVSSAVEVRELDLSADLAETMALFEYYEVPDERRIAPSVFFGDEYLSGEREIADSLISQVKSGAAINTPFLQGTVQSSANPITLLGAVAAGLTAGLNPCALSMLLILSGALLSAKRKPLLYGTVYLVGKLAVYLAIGFLFADLWARYAPSWFPIVIRVLMTTLGVFLIALNISDAISARAQQYGRVRNRLPKRLYARLRNIIRKGASVPGTTLVVTVLAVGAFVAASEFFCAGQLYTAVLVANVQKGNTRLPLVLYCLAFLVPSAVLLFGIAASRKTLDGSDWILNHTVMIKFVTSAVMAAVIVYMWCA